VSEVTEAIAALERGDRTLEDVERLFLNRTWPMLVPQQDSDEQPEGSFGEVADAYSNGQLSHEHYVILAEAAREAIRNQREQSR
jgi:hypothetical protein